MKQMKGAAQRRPVQKKRDKTGLWVVIAVVLVLVLGGGGLYAASAQGQEKPGVIVAERTKADIGNVKYSGGLGKATFNLTVQGGPVIVRGLETT